MSEDFVNGGPGFPFGHYANGGNSGISLRDWFSGQALAGELASQSEAWNIDTDSAPIIARRCYEFADAMLKARNGEEEAE